jgi:hypothetical protein
MAAHAHSSDALKDEVYRQMFRLEARRPGAEMDLAIALIRACAASCSSSGACKQQRWLEKICPICLAMLELAQHAHQGTPPETR